MINTTVLSTSKVLTIVLLLVFLCSSLTMTAAAWESNGVSGTEVNSPPSKLYAVLSASNDIQQEDGDNDDGSIAIDLFSVDLSATTTPLFESDDESPLQGILEPGKTIQLTWKHISAPDDSRIDIIVTGVGPNGKKKRYALGRTTIDAEKITMTIPNLDIARDFDNDHATIIAVVTHIEGPNAVRRIHIALKRAEWYSIPSCEEVETPIAQFPPNTVDRCINGGKCDAVLGMCMCAAGFVGSTCQHFICEVSDEMKQEQPIIPGRGIDCNPHGYRECIVHDVTYTRPSPQAVSTTSVTSSTTTTPTATAEDKCACAEGWNGHHCDEYRECQRSDLQCVNGFIGYDLELEQCATESCTCRGEYAGATCDQCPLKCKRGKLPTDCTACDCPRGFDGMECECRVQYISFSFGRYPSFVERLVSGDLAKIINQFNPYTDMDRETKYSTYHDALRYTAIFSRFTDRIALLTANDLQLTPTNRIFFHEAQIDTSTKNTKSLVVSFGIRDTCSNTAQDLRDVEEGWATFIAQLKFTPDLFDLASEERSKFGLLTAHDIETIEESSSGAYHIMLGAGSYALVLLTVLFFV